MPYSPPFQVDSLGEPPARYNFERPHVWRTGPRESAFKFVMHQLARIPFKTEDLVDYRYPAVPVWEASAIAEDCKDKAELVNRTMAFAFRTYAGVSIQDDLQQCVPAFNTLGLLGDPVTFEDNWRGALDEDRIKAGAESILAKTTKDPLLIIISCRGGLVPGIRTILELYRSRKNIYAYAVDFSQSRGNHILPQEMDNLRAWADFKTQILVYDEGTTTGWSVANVVNFISKALKRSDIRGMVTMDLRDWHTMIRDQGPNWEKCNESVS